MRYNKEDNRFYLEGDLEHMDKAAEQFMAHCTQFILPLARDARIAALESNLEDTIKQYHEELRYAQRIATAIHAKRFPLNQTWQVRGDLAGVLTQIDNMTVDGVARAKSASVSINPNRGEQ